MKVTIEIDPIEISNFLEHDVQVQELDIRAGQIKEQNHNDRWTEFLRIITPVLMNAFRNWQDTKNEAEAAFVNAAEEKQK